MQKSDDVMLNISETRSWWEGGFAPLQREILKLGQQLYGGTDWPLRRVVISWVFESHGVGVS